MTTSKASQGRKRGTTKPPSLRLGLCCQFINEPIAFRTTTATALLRLDSDQRRRKLSNFCRSNAESLLAAVRYLATNGIGCFRIPSSILPVRTHPQAGYDIADLPGADEIVAAFRRCGELAAAHRIRLTFHPDQFVVLNSPRDDVVRKSLEELESQAEIAEWVGADLINIHAGGAYGDKVQALDAFVRNVDRLSDRARMRLSIENDDRIYTPADLLPVCRTLGLPLVYDVHHHRCLPDGFTVEAATKETIETWNREPLFHISSPIAGWDGRGPHRHHDYIDPQDFPDCWRDLPVTVEVEAKAKELAVLKLQETLGTLENRKIEKLVSREAGR
ncbi:MAG: UV DNA damage repair endonuclease UvsE [Planctomycetaceae bacterium]